MLDMVWNLRYAQSEENLNVKSGMSKGQLIEHQRLSMIRWETLRNQVANRVNIQPITTGEIVLNIGNLDILISNKFILGRNNDRCPTGPLTVTSDPRKIIRANMTCRTNKRHNRRISNSSSWRTGDNS